MKDKSSIYFMVFAFFNTLVGSLVLVLNLSILSTEDYGIFVLYGTYLSYLTITAFGIQDGLRLRIRKKKLIDIKFGTYIFKIRAIYLIQFFIAITLLIFFNNFIGFVIMLSFPFNNIIIINRQNYLSMDKLVAYNVTDLLLKLFQIISIIIVAITNSGITTLLVLNLLYRILIVLILAIYNNLYIYKYMDRIGDISKMDKFSELFEDTKIGLAVTCALWTFNFCLWLDVLVLRNNVTALGIYSQSKSIALVGITILIPLSALIFAKFSSNSSKKEMEMSVRRLFSISVIFVFAYLFAYKMYGFIDIKIFDLVFSKTTLLIILIFPFLSVMSIYFINVLMILNVKKLLVSNILLLCIFISSYIIFSFTNDALYQVLLGNVLAYFSSMLLLCFVIIGFKRTLFILIDMVLYLITFFMSIFSIVIIFIAVCYFARNEIINILKYIRRYV